MVHRSLRCMGDEDTAAAGTATSAVTDAAPAATATTAVSDAATAANLPSIQMSTVQAGRPIMSQTIQYEH